MKPNDLKYCIGAYNMNGAQNVYIQFIVFKPCRAPSVASRNL